MAVPALAVIVNFDDIAIPLDGPVGYHNCVTMPSPYGGFNWEGSYVWATNTIFARSDNITVFSGFAVPSTPNFLFVGGWGDQAVTISIPISFKLTNMDLAIPDSENVTMSFYLGGNLLVSSDYFRPGTDLNTFYPTGVLGPDYYDKLVIYVGQDDYFLIDNFAATLTSSPISPNVPIPTSLLLVGSGLLGLAGLRRQYKQ